MGESDSELPRGSERRSWGWRRPSRREAYRRASRILLAIRGLPCFPQCARAGLSASENERPGRSPRPPAPSCLCGPSRVIAPLRACSRQPPRPETKTCPSAKRLHARGLLDAEDHAHLQPGNFTAEERAFVDVQLADGKVLSVAGRVG